MEILLWIITFITALAVLIKSADIFTKNSEKLGKILGIPQFIIGVSIVALGTSLPEFATSVFGTLKGYSSIVAANVVGSNIANILLVMGVSSLIAKKIVIEKNLIKLDLPILIGITALQIVLIYDGEFTIIEGFLMLLTYGVYISYNFSEHRSKILEKLGDKIEQSKEKFDKKIMLYILMSAIGIFIGAKYTVESIVELSSIMNIAPSAIAISAVAIGTSLPELMVAISASRAKNYEMVIGNVIGSNIFNATVVMAVPTVMGTLNITSEVITIAIPFLIIATLLFTFSGIEKKIYSFEGALYAILYFVFIGQLFNFL